MVEKVPNFTPYADSSDEERFGEIKSAEQAERYAKALIETIQEQRKLNTFENLAANPNAWEVFYSEYDRSIKRELDGLPSSQSDHMVFAAYRMQMAKAIEQYLYQEEIQNVPSQLRRGWLKEARLTALAESEQAAATAIFRCGTNSEMRRSIAAMYASIDATAWNKEASDNYQRLVSGAEFVDSQERSRALKRLSGVTGHAAAIELLQELLDCTTYSPAVELDGKHAIDIGAHSRSLEFQPIDTVVQVKVNSKLESTQGAFITPVAVSRQEELPIVRSRDTSKMSIIEKNIHAREKAMAQLQHGALWLQARKYPDVDNETLVAVLIELRSSQYGHKFDEFREDEGYFDISTGLCNSALCDEVLGQKESVQHEIATMRARGGRRIVGKRLYGSMANV